MLVTSHLKFVVFATIMLVVIYSIYVPFFALQNDGHAPNNRVLNLPINLSSTLICTPLKDVVINTIFHSSMKVMKRLVYLYTLLYAHINTNGHEFNIVSSLILYNQSCLNFIWVGIWLQICKLLLVDSMQAINILSRYGNIHFVNRRNDYTSKYEGIRILSS